MEKDATELEYLQWFFGAADFGPADEDVRDIMNREFESDTGLRVPAGYRQEE